MCPLTQVCVVYVVYVVKEVASFRGLSQLLGVARNRTRGRALQTSRKKERKKERCSGKSKGAEAPTQNNNYTYIVYILFCLIKSDILQTSGNFTTNVLVSLQLCNVSVVVL